MKPRAPKGRLCPFWRRDMALVCHKCPLWTHLRGKNPQSEQEIDEWGCALAWLPLLLVEGAQQTRQAGAAIESFRNEISGCRMPMMRCRSSAPITGGWNPILDR